MEKYSEYAGPYQIFKEKCSRDKGKNLVRYDVPF